MKFITMTAGHLCPRPSWSRVALLLILSFHGVVVLYSSLHLSPAADESVHVRSGLTFLTQSAYVDAKKAWWTALDYLPPPLDVVPALLARWSGQSPDYRDDFRTYFEHLLIARLANHVIGALLLILVYFWAVQLWGGWGGTIAAAFLAFNPLFLAHSTIVSSDLYMALGGLVGAYSLWKVFLASPDPPIRLDRRFWRGALLCGLALGFAIICKVSNIIFLPLMGIVAAWAGWVGSRRQKISLARGFFRPILSALVSGIIALILAVAVYGATHADPPSIQIAGRSRNLPIGQALAVSIHSAMSIQKNQSQVFFMGKFEKPGPWHYAAGFLLKTPLGLLFILPFVLAVILLDRRQEIEQASLIYLLGLIITLGLVFTTRGFYLGQRHLLLLIVLLSVLAGILGGLRAVFEARAARLAMLGIGLCLGWAAADAGWASPWHLSYFNTLGRDRLALVDSDGDWGEGLLALHNWQQRNAPNQPVWLAYFGSNMPGDFGVCFRGLVSPFSFVEQDPERDCGRDPKRIEGYVAISKTQLAGVYMDSVGKGRDYYVKWQKLKPDWIVGGSIYIFDRHRKVADRSRHGLP